MTTMNVTMRHDWLHHDGGAAHRAADRTWMPEWLAETGRAIAELFGATASQALDPNTPNAPIGSLLRRDIGLDR